MTISLSSNADDDIFMRENANLMAHILYCQ